MNRIFKTIIWRAFIGAVFGAAVTLIYMISAFFDQMIFEPIIQVLYYTSVTFAWPFGFLITFLEESTNSYFGTMLGFFLASSLGGFLYGGVIGCIVCLAQTIHRMCKMNDTKKAMVHRENPLVTGAIIDLLLLLVASLIMDGGVFFCAASCLVAGHWVGNVVILLRRKDSLTRFDMEFIRFFSLGSAVVVFVIELVLSHI